MIFFSLSAGETRRGRSLSPTPMSGHTLLHCCSQDGSKSLKRCCCSGKLMIPKCQSHFLSSTRISLQSQKSFQLDLRPSWDDCNNLILSNVEIYCLQKRLLSGDVVKTGLGHNGLISAPKLRRIKGLKEIAVNSILADN